MVPGWVTFHIQFRRPRGPKATRKLGRKEGRQAGLANTGQTPKVRRSRTMSHVVAQILGIGF